MGKGDSRTISDIWERAKETGLIDELSACLSNGGQVTKFIEQHREVFGDVVLVDSSQSAEVEDEFDQVAYEQAMRNRSLELTRRAKHTIKRL